jgi:hypothetical protein
MALTFLFSNVVTFWFGSGSRPIFVGDLSRMQDKIKLSFFLLIKYFKEKKS